jgi:branched-chain amino acid transport system permease protein
MTEFWQQVVSGLASGGIYASLALAIVLIYRSTRVVNFAQGEMGMFATFIAWWLVTEEHWPYWGAFFATLALAFVGGALLERVVIRPVESAPALTAIIVTVGLFIALNGAAFWIWGGESRSFPSAFSTRPVEIGGVAFSIQDFGVIGVTLAAAALLGLFFRFTKVGLGLRAAALDPDAGRLVGIRVGWMLALGWGLASVLGALSGLMIAPSVFLDPNMMQPVLVYALGAAILGGLESPVGAVVGGLLLGVGLNLLGTYVDFVGQELKVPVAFAVVLGVLLVRPAGLFGRAAARSV